MPTCNWDQLRGARVAQPVKTMTAAMSGIACLFIILFEPTINMSVSVKARRLSLNTFNVLVVCFLTILLEIPQVAASPQNVQEAT